MRVFLSILSALGMISTAHALGLWGNDIVNRYVYVSLKASYQQVPYDENGQPEWTAPIESQLIEKAQRELRYNCEEVYGGEYLEDVINKKRVGVTEKEDYAVYTFMARGHCKEAIHVFSDKSVNGSPRGMNRQQAEETEEYIIGYGNHGEDA